MGILWQRCLGIIKCSVLVGTVAALNFFLAHALFGEYAVHIIANRTNNSATERVVLATVGSNSSREAAKLNKMQKLWPPHTHPFPYIVYTLSTLLVAWTSELPMAANAGEQLQKIPQLKEMSHLAWHSTVISVALFIWIAMPLRIAEMHYAVMLMNFLHILLSNLLATFLYHYLMSEGIRMRPSAAHEVNDTQSQEKKTQ